MARPLLIKSCLWLLITLLPLLAYAIFTSGTLQAFEAPTVSNARSGLADETRAASVESWPFHWNVGNFRLHSTVPEHVLRESSQQLLSLAPQIERTLGVKLNPSEVHLVVLNDNAQFERYVNSHFPNTPNRRALYVQKRDLGVVITFYHSDWLTDARHECTHALLHQSGISLPLWLDEGVAEYFENHSSDPRYHPEHRPAIDAQLRFGQVAQIAELEDRNSVSLDSKGYKDAWGVVAFMIHHSDDTRRALSDYINDLHRGTAAGYLSRRLDLETRRNWRYHYEQFFSHADYSNLARRSVPKSPSAR